MSFFPPPPFFPQSLRPPSIVPPLHLLPVSSFFPSQFILSLFLSYSLSSLLLSSSLPSLSLSFLCPCRFYSTLNISTRRRCLLVNPTVCFCVASAPSGGIQYLSSSFPCCSITVLYVLFHLCFSTIHFFFILFPWEEKKTLISSSVSSHVSSLIISSFFFSPLPSIINLRTTISRSEARNDCRLRNTGVITRVHLMELIAQRLASLLASPQVLRGECAI